MTAFPLKSEYSVAELIEFGQRIAALYGREAKGTFVISCESDRTTATIIITARKGAADRHIRGESWLELLEAAEKDAALWVMSNREMTAADLGIDA